MREQLYSKTIILLTEKDVNNGVVSYNGSIRRVLLQELNFTGETTPGIVNNDTGGIPTDAQEFNNWWALLALALVLGTAAGNILVCLAIAWERRLQNVTNYFLMSLAITDLMVAILVMPLGILTLVRGRFPLAPVYCLAWICLDVLFCTASIMHLCTISVDRYLSLRYPMKFGRNKTRRRVTLKIIFVWLLSIAMSLPLSLMYSKNQDSVLINNTCQIPDPLYKLIGSIISFYIPLGVMLGTYALTVRLLARQQRGLANVTGGWSSGWMGAPAATPLERRCTWRRLLHATRGTPTMASDAGLSAVSSCASVTAGGGTPQHAPHSVASTDTELTTLDTHELWLQPDNEPLPQRHCTLSALHAFGAEMLKLSRGLEVAATTNVISETSTDNEMQEILPASADTLPRVVGAKLKSHNSSWKDGHNMLCQSHQSKSSLPRYTLPENVRNAPRRRSSTFHGNYGDPLKSPYPQRRRGNSFHDTRLVSSFSSLEEMSDRLNAEDNSSKTSPTSIMTLPPPCTCPYFGDKPPDAFLPIPIEVKIISSDKLTTVTKTESEIETCIGDSSTPGVSSLKRSILAKTRSNEGSPSNMIVTWEFGSSLKRNHHHRGSSFGSARTSLAPNNASTSHQHNLHHHHEAIMTTPTLRRSATMRHSELDKPKSALGALHRFPATSTPALTRTGTIRSHHSRNSSVISRNSSRHGRIIRLEQKATKVLGVVFFTFVILWAPFFVLNLVPSVCADCEEKINPSVLDFVTWLGYASSMVNPIFYTIFNKVFRQAFKKVLTCKYRNKTWRPQR